MRQGVDHIIFAAPDLESGMDTIEALLGVRPVIGGRHPQYGTHNALLSLGPATYLEVIAPDPAAGSMPDQGVLFGLDNISEARLVTWVLRTEEIEMLAENAEQAGVGLGAIEAGKREKPDGTVLRWKASDPYVMRFDGAFPFAISWGDTPHPAAATPPGGELVGLRVEHPEPEAVRAAYEAIGASIPVEAGDKFRLVATIKTENGVVELD